MTQNTPEFALNVTLLVIAVFCLFHKLLLDVASYLRSEDGLDRLHDIFRLLPPAGQLKIASILIKYQSIKRKKRRLHARHPEVREDKDLTAGTGLHQQM
jgi:hypothetical protein